MGGGVVQETRLAIRRSDPKGRRKLFRGSGKPAPTRLPTHRTTHPWRKKSLPSLQMGLGRSPTCAAAYLVYCGIPLRDARELILSKRSVWNGEDGNYASGLGDFGKMLEIARTSE